MFPLGSCNLLFCRGSSVRFPEGLGIFLFTTVSTTALGCTQPPIQWVLGILFLVDKAAGT
jgi:hypothetical protein